jgi:beta-carotene/zeaxanthin 4-ketolase
MGIIIALLILICWGIHLIYTLLYQPVDFADIWFWIHVLVQTWLFTGLFITGHDSMHGTISRDRRINNLLGFLAITLYAGLWYSTLKKKHYLHHIHVGTEKDPDYHKSNQNFFIWWFSFMKQYLTIWQLIIMAAIFNVGLLFFNELQLIMLWIVPSVLSTFQLFFFGTYLPHRLPHTIEMEPYKSRSQKRNHFRAMISCYFFGYHYEHHESPQTPWWRLYQIKKL